MIYLKKKISKTFYLQDTHIYCFFINFPSNPILVATIYVAEMMTQPTGRNQIENLDFFFQFYFTWILRMDRPEYGDPFYYFVFYFSFTTYMRSPQLCVCVCLENCQKNAQEFLKWAMWIKCNWFGIGVYMDRRLLVLKMKMIVCVLKNYKLYIFFNCSWCTLQADIYAHRDPFNYLNGKFIGKTDIEFRKVSYFV